MPDITLTITEAAPVNLTIGGGASAYQIWLDAGNTGTEQDFLDSLVGADGAPGASDALGTGFTSGGGTGNIPDETTVKTRKALFLQDDDSSYNPFGFVANLEFGQYYNVEDGTAVESPGSFCLKTGDADRFSQIAVNGEENVIRYSGTAISDEYQTTLEVGSALMRVTSKSGSQQVALNISAEGSSFQDLRAAQTGLEYADDYSADIKTNNRSLPDVGTVNLLKQNPVSYSSAAAPNNTIFYSTTVNKLCYKDPGGTVNPLY